MPEPLQEEIKYFEENRNDLVSRYRNLFVLIKGHELVGAYPDAASAFKVGVQRYKMEPFLVKQVLENEPVSVVPMFSGTVPNAHI